MIIEKFGSYVWFDMAWERASAYLVYTLLLACICNAVAKGFVQGYCKRLAPNFRVKFSAIGLEVLAYIEC